MEKNKKFIDWMEERGETVKSLARRLQITERVVQYWINGRNDPSVTQLIKMSKLFNENVVELYDMFHKR